MAHWWRRDELLALLQAWEETIEPPRDRDELDELHVQRLFSTFDALRPRDGATIAIQDVEAQRQRLVRTFLFLRAFNAESERAGRPTWFQLPTVQQDQLRLMNGRLGDLAVVTQDEFKRLCQVCEAPPVQLQDPPLHMQSPVQRDERPMADEMKAAAEALAGLPMFRSNEPPTLSPSQSPPSSPKNGVIEKEEKQEETSDSDLESASEPEDSEYTPFKKSRKNVDADYTPPKGKGKGKGKMASKWSKRDEQRLLSAWHEVVTSLSNNGYDGSFASRNEGLRLNSLIHQRYVELCGDKISPRTNQSTGAKKHAIVMAFRALRNVLRTLASLSDRPNWFGMTPDERMELQKRYGHHNEQACLIEKETYQRLVAIDRAQQTILTPTEHARRAPATLDQLLGRTKEGFRKKGKKSAKDKYASGPPRGYVVAERSSEESDDSSDAASTRNGRTENSSRGANSHSRQSHARKHAARRFHREVTPTDDVSTYSPPKRRRTGLSDAKWVNRLLAAQTQRFEALLAEFQEERRQERQHNVEIILEALKLRSESAQKADQPSQYVEALVEKQRQHLLGLFNQLQDERSQEREQARMLLRELGTSRILRQDQEQEN